MTQHSPVHISGTPSNKHSGLVLTIHPNVRLNPTKTTPIHHTSKSYSANRATSRNQYTIIHYTNTTLGNNLRQSTISYLKLTTSPTTHNRTKISHRIQRRYKVGPLWHPPNGSRYYQSQATSWNSLIPPGSMCSPPFCLSPQTVLDMGSPNSKSNNSTVCSDLIGSNPSFSQTMNVFSH